MYLYCLQARGMFTLSIIIVRLSYFKPLGIEVNCPLNLQVLLKKRFRANLK